MILKIGPMWVMIPLPVWLHFRDIEVATPVVGLIPRIDPSISISSNVANDPIEEELRLAVSMNPMLVHFHHHQATEIRLGAISLRCTNLCEVMGMKLASLLLDLLLEWVCFFTLRKDIGVW